MHSRPMLVDLVSNRYFKNTIDKEFAIDNDKAFLIVKPLLNNLVFQAEMIIVVLCFELIIKYRM